MLVEIKEITLAKLVVSPINKNKGDKIPLKALHTNIENPLNKVR